jgi:hypothetical protein
MNKFPIFLAFAAFALFACSENKPEPVHSELCTKKPIPQKCLIGNWILVDVEGGGPGCKANDDILKLKADGQYTFTSEFETNGYWELNDNVIKIDCISGDCDPNINYPIDATIEIRRSGEELRIATNSSFSSFLQCSGGRFTEVFSWQGND